MGIEILLVVMIALMLVAALVAVESRDLLSSVGIRPRDVRTLADLAKIPLTPARDYRGFPPDRILASWADPGRLKRFMTSGSSGRPLRVWRAGLEDHLTNLFVIRALRQFGVRPGQLLAVAKITSQAPPRSSLLARAQRTARFFGQHPVDSERPPEEFFRELEELGPDFLLGFPSVLIRLGHWLEEAGRPRLRLRGLITGAEVLYPSARKRLESCFGARVFDRYGTYELGHLAWECPSTGLYHVSDDNVILEVISNGRPARGGERGRVVATNLNYYAMPLIRYGLDDIVVKGPSPCPCGQPFSTIKEIQGRVRDYFTLPGGVQVHPKEIIVPLLQRETPWIHQFQLVQEEKGLIVLHLLPAGPVPPGEPDRITGLARQKLGEGVRFRTRIVDRSYFETRGKLRASFSKVSPDTP